MTAGIFSANLPFSFVLLFSISFDIIPAGILKGITCLRAGGIFG